jgi:hypothetical protein
MVSIYCTITLTLLHINSLTRYTIPINPPGPEINPNNFIINIHSGLILLKCFNYPFHETFICSTCTGHPAVPTVHQNTKIMLLSCTGTISHTLSNLIECCGVQLKRDGTRWRTGGEVKWKLANGVWVASTLHTTSEHGVSSITTADAHNSAASSGLNWRPCRFKWTRPFRRKTKSGFCANAITFQTQSNYPQDDRVVPNTSQTGNITVSAEKRKIFHLAARTNISLPNLNSKHGQSPLGKLIT